MNISKVIPGFHNGVSQQSPTMRLDTQVEEAENCLGTLVSGTIKRPNTDFIAVLTSTADGDAFFHPIIRDETEQYLLVLTGDPANPIEIFKTDGTPCVVLYGTLDESLAFTEDATVKTYLDLAGGTAKNGYRAVTIADHTFIVNKTVITGAGSTVSHSGGSLDGSVQSFDKLTDVSAAEGEVWEVTGNDTNHFDNYYVQKQAGTLWLETIAPNIPYTIEGSLMPHRLVRTAVNTFVFAPIVWAERTCGDEASAPMPSFIGNRISSIFFFRNRLGFLSGDSVCLSAAGDYYRFFPSTALDILDDDPIDISASLKEVSTLHSVAGFNKQLLIFGSPNQFSLSSGDNSLLTPATVSLDATTRFAVQPNCEPVSMGSTVYFAHPREQSIAIREYLVQENTLMDDAADVTAHCPTFIPVGNITLAGLASQDLLFVHTSGDPAALYVYKFYWVGNEKVQSAWHRWSFDDAIIGLTVIDEVLYIIFEGNETKLERVYTEAVNDGSLSFRCHLDHKVAIEGEYEDEVTTFVLPYTPKMGSIISGGIDEYTALMLKSETAPYLGKVTEGLDSNTILLIRSNGPGEDPYEFVDISEAERTVVQVPQYETSPNLYKFVHTSERKKFGATGIECGSATSTLAYPRAGSQAAYDFDWNSNFTFDCWVFMEQYISNGDELSNPWGWESQRAAKHVLIGEGAPDYQETAFIGLHIGSSKLQNKLQFVIGLDMMTATEGALAAIDGHDVSSGHFYLFVEDKLGAFPINQWVHVALERSADRFSLFRDGIKVAETLTDFIHTITDTAVYRPGDLLIAAEGNGFFMDEVRLSNVARYGGAFRAIGSSVYVPEEYMYGSTPRVFSTSLEDLSSFQHSVAFDNGYHSDTQEGYWPVRFLPTSFFFDPAFETGIDVAHHAIFNLGNADFTIDLSLHFKSLTACTLLSKSAPDELGWKISWNGTGVSFEWSPDGTDANLTSAVWTFDLTADVWYHLALVRLADIMTLYINGQSKGSISFTGTIQPTTLPLRIGSDIGGGNHFFGAMEEIRFSHVARWTGPFLPPLRAYSTDADGWYNGIDGGLPEGFDRETMDPEQGLNYLARHFGIEVVHPLTGMPYPEATIFGNEVYVRENLAGFEVIIGRNYTMNITLSPVYLSDPSGKAELIGRLQIRNMTLSFKDTGHFEFTVAPIGRPVMTHLFTGSYIGAATIGQIGLQSAEKTFAVLSNAKTTQMSITSESYLPTKIQSAAYEATFTKRSRSR
jgi:hypothetical protein